MGDPFYGNGAGVQCQFEFSKEETVWLETPYKWRNVDKTLATWLRDHASNGDRRVWGSFPGYPRCAAKHGLTPYGLLAKEFRRDE